VDLARVAGRGIAVGLVALQNLSLGMEVVKVILQAPLA
jgi:hypothetical protein